MSIEIALAYVADRLRTRRQALQPEDVGLRRNRDRDHRDSAAAQLVLLLQHCSKDFAEFWRRGPQPNDFRAARPCRIVHPSLGVIDLQREILSSVDPNQRVVVYLAVPGTESHTN